MDKILYNWLETEWKKSNHTKYQQYFKEWVTKLTDSQINGFNRMRIADYINHQE